MEVWQLCMGQRALTILWPMLWGWGEWLCGLRAWPCHNEHLLPQWGPILNHALPAPRAL